MNRDEEIRHCVGMITFYSVAIAVSSILMVLAVVFNGSGCMTVPVVEPVVDDAGVPIVNDDGTEKTTPVLNEDGTPKTETVINPDAIDAGAAVVAPMVPPPWDKLVPAAAAIAVSLTGRRKPRK